MIDRIVGICLHKRFVVMAIALLAAGYGYYAWTQLKLEAYPEISDVFVKVTTQAAGLAAEEVEQQITTPLERTLASTPGLVAMHSSSTFGLSLITMVFRDGSEDYWSRQRVTERINQVNLPAGITPAFDPLYGTMGELLRYTLQSDSKNLMELSDIQNWVVGPALLKVPGITNVETFGGFTKQYQLELNPVELQRYGLGLNDVVTAINNNSSNAGGGRIARGEQSYVIRGIGLVRTLEDLGNIVVTQRNGIPILVRDLGTLQFGHQEREGIVGQDNNPDVVQGTLQMLKGENPSVVLKRIHAKVDELNKKLAGQDVKIVPYIDRADLVGATVEKVAHTVGEGMGLVFIVLMLFLGSLRSAFVVAVTIPMALVAVFTLINLTGMAANLLSLGSIDFGVIVDGAIVVMEAILRLREEKPTEALTEDEVRNVTGQIAKPIFFATLIIITAYLPLFAFERAEAKLFTPIAYTITYALFGALLCTMCLVPGLAFEAFRKPRKMFHNRVLEWLHDGYFGILSVLLRRPAIIYVTVLISFSAVGILGATIGREFLPNLDEGSLWLQVQMPTGISLDKASEMASELRRALREFPEVATAVTQVGRSDDQTDPWTPSHIEAPVALTPYDTWPNGETKEEFLRRLDARLKQLPGFDISISQPIIDNVNEAVSGAHSPLVLKIFGDDLHELRSIGDQIVDVLNGIRGTTEASLVQEPPIPQVAIEVDRAAAARYGINVSDIGNLIQTGVGGATIGNVYVGDRIYGLSVRFPKKDRDNPEVLGNLILNTPGGAQILLSQVASIKLQNGESSIAHDMTRRNLTVKIDYRNRDLSSYLAEAQEKIDKTVHFDPNNYHIEWGGQFENQRRAQQRLIFILGIVLALMALFLYMGFGTLRQALLILSVVPLATLGGLTALHLRGETLNVATAVGFIALFGVAVQNGVIMVSNLNRLRAHGHGLRNAVLHGACERFRPVLMTATVATVGMVPAALATGIGSDVQRGLATVVVGGLIVATLLTLFILPTLYFVMERFIARLAPAALPAPAPGE
jgi:cobalt-zinc-cadmium resistance protein CzcA